MLLRAVEQLPPSSRAAITASLTREERQLIEATVSVGWMPMLVHMKLSDAAFASLGEAGLRGLFERTMLSTWEQPLLRSFVQTSTGLFGLTPASLARHAGSVYQHLTRRLGDLEALVREREVQVKLRGFPAQAFQFPCYVAGLQGCLQSLLPLTSRVGTVEVTHRDLQRGDVGYLLRW